MIAIDTNMVMPRIVNDDAVQGRHAPTGDEKGMGSADALHLASSHQAARAMPGVTVSAP